MLIWWLNINWFLLWLFCFKLTAYGGKGRKTTCFGFVSVCGTRTMCGLARSCLWRCAVCSKQVLTFRQISISLIALRSEKSTHKMWYAHQQWIQLMCFECTAFGFWHLSAAQFSPSSASVWLCGKSFPVSRVCT